jgi:drug/metabolite transporter (DMT)-like permease
MITALLVAIMVMAEAASDVLITRAMKGIGAIVSLRPRALLSTARRVLTSLTFWSGIALSALHFAAFLALLSYVDLSIVVRASALIFVAGTLGARLFLKETITPQRWAGSCLVCVGVAMVSMH